MLYKNTYTSPIGAITMVSDENNLIGLWFENQKYYMEELNKLSSYNFYDISKNINTSKVITDTVHWLDYYFKGKSPDFYPQYSLELLGKLLNISDFRLKVWKILQQIPFGETVSYGFIAKQIASSCPKAKVSSQAVGGAVSHNPISIIIPCHRVIGSNSKLTGYAGGLAIKEYLLNLERKQQLLPLL